MLRGAFKRKTLAPIGRIEGIPVYARVSERESFDLELVKRNRLAIEGSLSDTYALYGPPFVGIDRVVIVPDKELNAFASVLSTLGILSGSYARTICPRTTDGHTNSS